MHIYIYMCVVCEVYGMPKKSDFLRTEARPMAPKEVSLYKWIR